MRWNNHLYLDFSQDWLHVTQFFLCEGVLCLQTIAFPYESSTVLTPGCNAAFRVGLQVENRFSKYVTYPLGCPLAVVISCSWSFWLAQMFHFKFWSAASSWPLWFQLGRS